MNRTLIIALIMLTGLAAAFRLPHLGNRPLHNDESINAVKLRGLLEQGQYQYDPHEYHGPVLYYAALPFLWVTQTRDNQGMTDARLRLVTAACGIAMVLLLALLADALGRTATLLAGTLLAISPALVFYSRYFIHEMLLTFFLLLLLGTGWRYYLSRHWGWALTGGIALGLMYATKETFVIPVAAMLGAVGGCAFWRRRRTPALPLLWPGLNIRHGVLVILAAVLVAEMFFSSFFTHARGPLDAIRTYLPWLKRAGGQSPHLYPWTFYWEHLFWFKAPKGMWWSEGLVLMLAIAGSAAAFWRQPIPGFHAGFARFLTLYTWLQALAYSLISYKTPWCMLGFYSGMILLAGLGFGALWQAISRFQGRLAAAVLLGVGIIHLGWESCRANFQFPADRRNPYVFSQTLPDIFGMINKLDALSRVHPQGEKMLIKVFANASEGCWPLPWYLRRFQRVGYWDALTPDPYAPAIIVDRRFNAYLDEKSEKKYLMTGYFELRPLVFMELYVDIELWKKYVATLPKVRDEE